MKTLLALCVLALTVIVAVNIHNRSEPTLHPDYVITALEYHETTTSIVARFAAPGAYMFWYVGFDIDTPIIFGAVMLVSWLTWLNLARVGYGVVSRLFGFANPNHDPLWTYLSIPWRPFYGGFRRLRRRYRDLGLGGKKAAAAFATWMEQMFLIYRRGMTYMGRGEFCGIPGFASVGWKTEGHEMAFGMTGSGKTSLAETKIALHEGSSILIDPAGAISRISHQRNGFGGPGIIGKKHRAFRLDPFNQAGPSNRHNPIDEIDRAIEREGEGSGADVRAAGAIVLGMIAKDPNDSKPFFVNSARGALLGAALYTWKRFPKGHPCRTLQQAVKFLLIGDTEDVPKKFTPMEWLLFKMSRHVDDCGGIIAMTAHWLMKGGKESTRDIISTVMSQTQWLFDPAMEAIMSGSDFSYDDFTGAKPCDLTINGPVTELQDRYAPWVRVNVLLAIEAHVKAKTRPKHDTLLVVDELACLGEIPSIANGPAHLRKHGLHCLLMAQDVQSVASIYPNMDMLLGNADAIYWLQTGAKSNLEELSRRLDTVTVTETVEGGVWSSTPGRTQATDRPLVYDARIRSYLAKEGRHVIVTRPTGPPLRLSLPLYFRELPVYYYQSADHRESFLRKLTRAFCKWWLPGPATPTSRAGK